MADRIEQSVLISVLGDTTWTWTLSAHCPKCQSIARIDEGVDGVAIVACDKCGNVVRFRTPPQSLVPFVLEECGKAYDAPGPH